MVHRVGVQSRDGSILAAPCQHAGLAAEDVELIEDHRPYQGFSIELVPV